MTHTNMATNSDASNQALKSNRASKTTRNHKPASRLASMFLAAVLAVSMMPAAAFATDDQEALLDPSLTPEDANAYEPEAVENELVVTYEDEPLGIHELNEGTSAEVEVVDKESIELAVPEADSVDVVTVSEDTDVDVAIEELASNPKVATVEPNYLFSKMEAPDASEALAAEATDAYADPAFLEESGDEAVEPGAVALADTDAVESDMEASPLATTNDTKRSSQYYLTSSGFLSAWDKAKCDGAVTVVVIDDGCMYEHRDLKANINTDYAYDAVTDGKLQSTPVDWRGENTSHGTNVAGIIAAVANNGYDVAGATYNAKVLPINVFMSNGKAKYTTILKALNYVEGLAAGGQVPNVRVLNMSFGAYDEDEIAIAMRNTLQRMRDRYNILPIAAGGNGTSGRPILSKSYPGDYDVCVSVTSLDRNGANSTWCDYNEYKDLAAPGEGIVTTSNNGSSTASVSGTSFSSPIVASAAALLYAANPRLTATQVENALKQTATRVTGNARPQSGIKGALNAKAAVDLARSGKTISNTPMARYTTMYRLYNPNSGEHFYTANAAERDNLSRVGWRYEGIGWDAPLTGNPVYRLYNPNAGDHHYTPNAGERDSLVRVGWNYEGIGWNTSVAETLPLYRLYNPNAVAGSHHYTLNRTEAVQLTWLGWRYEGIGWYGTN